MVLAHRGFDVTVFEKQARLGGRNAAVELGPYKFDLGPTFLMMKYLLDELFGDVGKRTEDYLVCERLDPMYRLQFGARSMEVTGDRERMKQNIETLFPGEGAGLDAFYAREAPRFARLYPCLQKDYGHLGAFVSLTLLKAFPHLAAGRSLYDVLSEYFRSEELRLAFTFQSKYLGMSPWDCPGLFAMIPYTEHAHGIFHVRGGLSEIPRAFARAAEEKGARIRLGTPVQQVLVEKGRAVGVRLENGETHRADDVVVNADFGYAVENLFPAEARRRWTPERIEKSNYSCSTFMMYLGVDKVYDCEHHAIFFAENYKANLEDISRHLRLSDDVSIYVRNASPKDPTLAPAGHSALYILVPMPNNRSGIDWSREKARLRDRVLDILHERTPYKNLREHIVEELVVTPEDWEKRSDVYRGATFNMGHNISQMLYARPHNAFEDFENCYLVGGGTHPGSGLPTIFESARISANLISKKYGVPYAAPAPFREPNPSGASLP
jgi:phytoene desaturase